MALRLSDSKFWSDPGDGQSSFSIKGNVFVYYYILTPPEILAFILCFVCGSQSPRKYKCYVSYVSTASFLYTCFHSEVVASPD